MKSPNTSILARSLAGAFYFLRKCRRRKANRFKQDENEITITDLVIDDDSVENWTATGILAPGQGFKLPEYIAYRLHLPDGRIDSFTTERYDASTGKIAIRGKSRLRVVSGYFL